MAGFIIVLEADDKELDERFFYNYTEAVIAKCNGIKR